MEKFWYLGTIILFAGSALVIELYRTHRILVTRKRLILCMFVVGVLFALFEFPALTWKVWGYSAIHTFNFRLLGVEIETYLFSVATTLAVAFATIVVSRREAEGKPILGAILRRIKTTGRK